MNRREKLYLAITIIITLVVALCSGLFFWRSYVRIGESLRDLGLAIAGVFCFVFNIVGHFNSGAVAEPSSVLSLDMLLDWSEIKARIVSAGQNFISGQNFINYMTKVFKSGYIVILLGTILIAFVLALYVILSMNLSGENVDAGKESRQLKAYKKLEKRVIYPAKRFLRGFTEYVKNSRAGRICCKIWLVFVIVSLNLPAIVIEAFAVYFYILGSFDFGCFAKIFTKLIADLSVPFGLPLIVWVIGIWIFILFWRKRSAMNKLYARDGLNTQFAGSLPTQVCVAAPMGYGKGRFLTCIVMIMQRIFREKALKSMLEIKSLFPDFDWRSFEELFRRSGCRKMSDIDRFADNYRTQFDRYRQDRRFRAAFDRAVKKGRVMPMLLGYDYVTYGFERNNGLKIECLWDCMRDYAKLFFIYDEDTSLIFSNYAICVRTSKADLGNFPLWRYGYFEDVCADEYRQNSHILDFNMLRLGKKVDGDVQRDNALEFGILAMQEMDKERGNQNDTREMKIKDDEANPKNDGVNSFIKMSNHMTYIRGEAYFFDINDMQRLDSINADFKEVGYQITLEREGKRKLLLPFFGLEELAYQILVPWWTRRFLDFRFRRGDKNLTFYLLDKLTSAVERHYVKAYNTYSCTEQILKLEGEENGKTFYVMPKQIYAGVYARDAMGDFFRRKAERSAMGIGDIPVYGGVRATYEELKEQHSYFVDKWDSALSEASEDGEE